MQDYYKKYKLWTLYFGAFFSGNRYFLSDFEITPIEFNRFFSPYYIDLINIPSEGYISYINFLSPLHEKSLPNGADRNFFHQQRSDTLLINFAELKKFYSEDCDNQRIETCLYYFGNKLTYNHLSGNFNKRIWTSPKQLYDIMYDLSLTYTGNITGVPEKATKFTISGITGKKIVFSGIGYGLHECYGCVDNISYIETSGIISGDYFPNCNTPLQELKTATFTIDYNTYNLFYNNSNPTQTLLSLNSENIDLTGIPLNSYIKPSSVNANLSKQFVTGYSISASELARTKNEIPLFFRTLNFNSLRLTPIYKDIFSGNYHLNKILNISGKKTSSYRYLPNLECGEKVYGSRIYNVPDFLFSRGVSPEDYVYNIYNSLISGSSVYEYEVTGGNYLPALQNIKERRSYYISNTGLPDPEIAITQTPGDSGIKKDSPFFTNISGLTFHLNAIDDLSFLTFGDFGTSIIKNKTNFNKDYYTNRSGDCVGFYMDTVFTFTGAGINQDQPSFTFSISGQNINLENNFIGSGYNSFYPGYYTNFNAPPGLIMNPRSTFLFTGGFTGGLPISIFFVESGAVFSGQKTIQSLNRSGYMTTRHINTGALINFTVVQNPSGSLYVTGLLTYNRIRNPIFRNDFQVGNLIMDTGRLLYYVNNSLIYSGNTGFNLEYMMLGSNNTRINLTGSGTFIGDGVTGLGDERAFSIFFPSTYYNDLFGFSGSIHEILIYNNFINDNHKNEVYSYLTNKWSGVYQYSPSGRVFYYTNKPNFPKSYKKNCSDCDSLIATFPKEKEKHIVLLEYNLYGFEDTRLEDCDIDMHAYMLKTGFHEEIVKKDPFISSFKINFNSGTSKESLGKIEIKSPNIHNICDMNFSYNSLSTNVQRQNLKEIKSEIVLYKPSKQDPGGCLPDYIKYGKIYGNQL